MFSRGKRVFDRFLTINYKISGGVYPGKIKQLVFNTGFFPPKGHLNSTNLGLFKG